MPAQEVMLKKVPSIEVASVRDTVPTTGISQLFTEVFTYLGQHEVNPAGPTMSIYYGEEFREEAVDVETAVPVSGTLPSGERVKYRELPPVEEAACIVHEGTFDNLAATCTRLMTWIETNGYRVAGPICEVYVHWAGPGGNPATNVTEIQIPVEKA
jgi:effector-binding domain-containing protein